MPKSTKKNSKIERIDNLTAHAAVLGSPIFSAQCVDDAIPEEWIDRAKQAWEYYIAEPLVSNVIETWVSFALGDVITVMGENDHRREEIENEMKELKTYDFLHDLIVQVLVKGEGYVYRYPKGQGGELERIQSLNATFIETKYKDGALFNVIQVADNEDPDNDDEEAELTIENILHIKWKSPAYAKHGNSMILPAFNDIELLRDYRTAQRAIAKRWITPLRLIKVGLFNEKTGLFHGCDQKTIDNMKKILNKMNGRNAIVVPFYVNVVTEGIDKAMPDMSKDIESVKEDILVAMGMSKSIITGDGPNYATANVAFKKIIGMLSSVQKIAKRALNWLFDPDDEFDFGLPKMDANNTLEIKKLLLELYDRGVLSKESIQKAMEVNPEAQDNQVKEQVIPTVKISDVIEAVKLGIMSLETARTKLGIDTKQETAAIASADADDVMKLYARALKTHRKDILDFDDSPLTIRTIADIKRYESELFINPMTTIAGCFDDCKVIEQIVKDQWTERKIEIDHERYGASSKHISEMVLCYSNHDGSFIGVPGEGIMKFIVKKGLTQIQAPESGMTVASIGFCEKEQKWYGWSHRAIYGFGVGSECKMGHCAYMPDNKETFLKDQKRWFCEDMYKNLKLTEVATGVKVSYEIHQEKTGKTFKSNDLIPYPDTWGRGEWKCKNLRDARNMAGDFAEGVASLLVDEEGMSCTGAINYK